MTTKLSNQKLIVSLIKSDLINYKLVSGLNDLGLQAHDYLLYLSEFIFDLMEFPESEQSEQTFEQYLQRLQEVKDISIKNNHEPLDTLALDIYNDLNRHKKNN